MTAYILTPEQHAQIVDALEYSTPIAEFDDMQSEATAQIEHNTALAMLKAMEPVTPACYGWRDKGGAVRDCIAPDTHQIIEGQYNVPLYAKEQQ